MKTSESIIEISKALFKFQDRVKKINKDSVNPFHKSKYASLANILNSIHDDLSDCGLMITQAPGGDGGSVALTTTLIHVESGEYMSSTFSMTPSKQDPQAICSCITYMRRYAITSILRLNVDDDDDGNAASRDDRGKDNERALNSRCAAISSKLDLCSNYDEIDQLIKEIQACKFSENQKSVLREKVATAKGRLARESQEI